MSCDRCDIKHSKNGEYYEMYVDNKFAGTYSTVTEAVKDFEEMKEQEEMEEFNHGKQ